MTSVTRRELLLGLVVLPLVKVERAAGIVASLGESAWGLRFFSEAEWRVVRVLVDDVLPRDERSGSATDAKVPEFMDVFLADPEIAAPLGGQIRSGLAWLAGESRRRFGRGYEELSEAERRSILEDVAWPARARPEMREGILFFSRFRDLTASGFWSSPVGYKDLEVQGGMFVAEWKGCPDEAMKKLGVG